ncbi:MAG: phosphate-starvation-inducible PsiE family protein [Desulfomonilia bacterium]|nr:phosphate-starvation-inducible PsiE family protein [Desulfomonilia bacterium]
MHEEPKSFYCQEPGHDLYSEHRDPVIRFLHKIIRISLRFLAILMVFVIVWGIGDVLYVLYKRLLGDPFMLLNINDILATFGAFLAVLIAIEIFVNITMYLSERAFPVQLVIATALMAIARKVIILDFTELKAEYIFATAAVVLALGITYWLISRRPTV